MKVAVIGIRGFPNIQGGVEKHCESLYPLIVETIAGIELIVFRRKPYLSEKNKKINYNHIRFFDLWTIKNKYLETILHSIIASFICVFKRPDLVHIHNIGPAISLPVLKYGKIPTVVTYHSDNYNHDKWGYFSKKILKLGEQFVGKMADRIIVVSQRQKKVFGPNSNVVKIPNGVEVQNISVLTEYLENIGVQTGKYILAVARFSPEKGLDLLVRAFQESNSDCRLVIAGDADHETDYSRNLKQIIDNDDRITRTGYITGEPLNQLFSHAKLFVLPSFHEGLPIALLEAMSYGLSVLVSDIPANLEVGLNQDRYFRCGSVADLKKKMDKLLEQNISDMEKQDMQLQILEKYNWLKIAEQTVAIYEKAIGK